MNWLDFTILALMLSGAIFGWLSGVLRWVFLLVGVVAGSILAGRFYGSVAGALEAFVESEALRQAAGFGLVFAGVLLASLFAAVMAKKAMQLVLLGWVDKAAGAAVGLLAGALTAAALTWILSVAPSEAAADAVRDSVLAEGLVAATGFLRAFLPSEFDGVELLFGQAPQPGG